MSKVSELLNQSFDHIRAALDSGEVSSTDLTRESLRRAHHVQPELNAFISVTDDLALQEAERADTRLRSGERGGILGIPVAVKDLICTRGSKTTAASKMLETFESPYDATVIEKLKRAGAPIIGKANLDEFAMGSSNETSHFGPCKNPWDLSRVPGGSSGGSAAVVAARIAPLALGTDTGGSIRQPASFCGLTGVKPTYGRVSRFGVVAFASSLDQVGPMASDAMGAAALLEVISGHDIRDATSAKREVPSFVSEARSARDFGHLRGLRVGIPRSFFDADGLDYQVSSIVRNSIENLREMGADIVEVALPNTRFSLPAYYLICTSEASSNLARYDGVHLGHRSEKFESGALEQLYSMSRGEGFGNEVKLRILLGTYSLSSGYYDAYYQKASQVRALIKKDFEEAFKTCDVIASPTSPTTAFQIGAKANDPVSMYLADIYTLSTNLAGIGGISFNVGFDSENLPVGMQLMSRWWDESALLKVASLYQHSFPQVQKLSPTAAAFSENSQ